MEGSLDLARLLCPPTRRTGELTEITGNVGTAREAWQALQSSRLLPPGFSADRGRAFSRGHLWNTVGSAPHGAGEQPPSIRACRSVAGVVEAMIAAEEQARNFARWWAERRQTRMPRVLLWRVCDRAFAGPDIATVEALTAALWGDSEAPPEPWALTEAARQSGETRQLPRGVELLVGLLSLWTEAEGAPGARQAIHALREILELGFSLEAIDATRVQLAAPPDETSPSVRIDAPHPDRWVSGALESDRSLLVRVHRWSASDDASPGEILSAWLDALDAEAAAYLARWDPARWRRREDGARWAFLSNQQAPWTHQISADETRALARLLARSPAYGQTRMSEPEAHEVIAALLRAVGEVFVSSEVNLTLNTFNTGYCLIGPDHLAMVFVADED